MATLRILRTQVGELTGSAVPDCTSGTVPFLVTLQDTTTGVQEQLYGCFNPDDAPCVDDGLLRVIMTATGDDLEGDPCSE